jgi:hypothetical protein
MKIHLGSSKTLHTECGQPVARRWWQESYNEAAQLGGARGILVSRLVCPSSVNCADCLRRKGPVTLKLKEGA